MTSLSKSQITSFQKKIYQYFVKNARAFPWRETDNPYNIFVSEVMLQQTQVDRVVSKYLEFTHVFPGFRLLAKAKFSEVLRVWKGLGYNRRALWLHKSAQIVIEEFGGELPRKQNILIKLPGIGPYTAASINAFAFNLPAVFVETNIRSVYIHEFFQNEKNVHDKDILPLVETTLDKQKPRIWYWALMDYGAFLKKNIGNPSRRSIHYKRQAPFRGSDREIRGYLLDIFLKDRSLSMNEILTGSTFEDKRIKKCVDDLYKEGLIKRSGNKFFIF